MSSCRGWFSRQACYLHVWMIAGQYLLEEDAEGEDVRCLRGGVSPEKFWSDVARCSGDEAHVLTAVVWDA